MAIGEYRIGELMSDEDSLAHYGVKGMKWGKRKKASFGEIQEARMRLDGKRGEYFGQKRKVKEAKKEAKASGNTAKYDKQKAKLDKMKVDFMNNPDRVTATRMSNGETALRSVLTTPIGGLAARAGASAVSRRIEYKQATGAYNKK